MSKNILNLFLLLAAIGFTNGASAYAGEFVYYQAVDVSVYLQGGNKVDPKNTIAPILESFGDYAIGDLYTYAILQKSLQSDYSGPSTTYYYKLVPRLSMGKLLGKDLSVGPLKDISFAQWISKTKDMGYSYFPGIGLDWQASWISWLRTMYYWERNPGQGWNDRRVHVDYGIPIPTRMGDFRIVGTFDHTFGLNDQAVTTDFKPELHYDLGKALGQPGGHLWVGVVVDLIKNKYKIQSSEHFKTNQASYGVLLRYSFN